MARVAAWHRLSCPTCGCRGPAGTQWRRDRWLVHVTPGWVLGLPHDGDGALDPASAWICEGCAYEVPVGSALALELGEIVRSHPASSQTA